MKYLIFILSVSTIRLDAIEDELIESNVKLIVLDSVASLVRKEFDSSAMPERQVLNANLFSSHI